MTTNRPIVELVEAIRGRSGNAIKTGAAEGLQMATVQSISPLTIKMHNLTISKNIYINPALILEASDNEEKIKEIFLNPFETAEAYQFLKEFHEKYVLKKGDSVFVYMTGNSFYIIGRAAKV